MTEDHVYGVRLFVPGVAATAAQWQGLLAHAGLVMSGPLLTSEALGFEVLVEWTENDGTFGRAFSHGTMSMEEQHAVAGAGSAWSWTCQCSSAPRPWTWPP